MEKIKKFLRDEEGVTAIEYALIAGLIVVGMVAGMTAFKNTLTSKISNVATNLGAL